MLKTYIHRLEIYFFWAVWYFGIFEPSILVFFGVGRILSEFTPFSLAVNVFPNLYYNVVDNIFVSV